MKSRIMIVSFAVILMMGIQAMAQECAVCTDANPCNTCSSCCDRGCELFGGLKNLMACRPCAPCAAPAPVCVACDPAPACAACEPAPACAACEAAPACAAPCCGPLFPCLKPALCNAGARVACVGNGARRMVSGLFGALADAAAPKCGCGCGIPSCNGGCGLGCGAPACSACGAPAEFGGCSVCGAAPAAPENAAPLPESPAVAE